jgi:hypothetical protein
VTHAEVQTRLRAYADGSLDEADAEVVRAHLASGCEDCLRDVFTRPVAMPRAPVVVQRPPRGWIAAALGGGVAIGLAAGLLAGGGHDAGPQSTLAANVEQLRADRERTETESQERLARLEAMLQDVQQRTAPNPLPRPSPPPCDPAPERDGVPDWLQDLLSTPGARVLPLRPAEPAPGASGYAVWSPIRGVVVVSATSLPVGVADAVYRVRVTMSDQSTVWLGDLPSTDGTLLVTVAMPEPNGRRVTGVDLFRDPPGAPALTATLRH